MARYVIVEFESNSQAEAFVERINSVPGRSFRARWMFGKPVKWCECKHSGNRGDEIRSLRGARYGWWVCADCKRPKKTNYQSPHNLLDPEAQDQPADQRRMANWMFMGDMSDNIV